MFLRVRTPKIDFFKVLQLMEYSSERHLAWAAPAEASAVLVPILLLSHTAYLAVYRDRECVAQSRCGQRMHVVGFTGVGSTSGPAPRKPLELRKGVSRVNTLSGKPPFHPENGGCLHGVCSPCGFPEKHEHISGRILDGLNESNVNEEV